MDQRSIIVHRWKAGIDPIAKGFSTHTQILNMFMAAPRIECKGSFNTFFIEIKKNNNKNP